MSRCLLDGSVAAVVGGATGIGRGVVDRFVEEGARVAVLDLDTSPLDDLASDRPAAVITVTGDASEPSATAALVDATVGAFGAIDTLVCCAGRFDFHAPIESLAPTELSAAFDEIFAVNVKSMVLAVRAAAGELRRQHGSVILTLSSSAFHPEGAGVLYGASKWAGRGLVAHLARELAPDVRVNGVAPGGTVRTSLSGLASLGEVRTVEDVPGRTQRLAAGNLLGQAAAPNDQAGPFVFLASPALSPFVNGAVVNSDGGRGDPIDYHPPVPINTQGGLRAGGS
ncbi:MAG TPA: SDR family NAD(P)-dependent oxidoreductase [Acidimicrobiales bacterium]|nr:SDR family NAD(P)-dependent oxidoreductase [Acidimicrobiales bacterium]